MAEEAPATDLISGGRLQMGVSRASPEPTLRGAGAFGYDTGGESDSNVARRKLARFGEPIAGTGLVEADPAFLGVAACSQVQPQSRGLEKRIWWGSATRESARWTGEHGMNLISSTLLLEDTRVSFDRLQAEQIAAFREAWAAAGWEHEPRISVSRSVIPIVTLEDQRYFGRGARDDRDQLE